MNRLVEALRVPWVRVLAGTLGARRRTGPVLASALSPESLAWSTCRARRRGS